MKMRLPRHHDTRTSARLYLSIVQVVDSCLLVIDSEPRFGPLVRQIRRFSSVQFSNCTVGISMLVTSLPRSAVAPTPTAVFTFSTPTSVRRGFVSVAI